MSLRLAAIPLIVFAFILYNIVVVFGANADEVLRKVLFSLPSLRGHEAARWTFTTGDLLILVTMILLFIELLKSTWTSSTSLLDHGLSMLVFIACLIEFLLVDRAFTSIFFFIMIAALIDVVAGYTIGIRVARRDLSIGAEH